MIVNTPITKSEIKNNSLVPKYDWIKMSIEEFQNWVSEVELGVNYQWNNGILEADEKMKLENIYILTNIKKLFKDESYRSCDIQKHE